MSLLRKIAFPLSLLYGAIVYMRNKLFDMAVFTSKGFQTPIVCVGNLSLGGTGKTPMVELLIRLLQQDYSIAVLSRGYKRKSKGLIVASERSTAEDLGDEPFQIHGKFPDITVAVDVNRRNGITYLEKEIAPDIILLDDAFQHRKVKAAFNILLTAYGNLYVNDWYLPTGSLRDSKSQAKRADIVLVTKCPQQISLQERRVISDKLNLEKGQEVLFGYLSYTQKLEGYDKSIALNSLKGRHFTLVTGIADPKPLVKYLTDNGHSFEHLSFGDHHFFTKKEIDELNAKALILTTEKDYTRLKGKVKNLFFIGVGHVLLADGEEVLKHKLDALTKRDS